MGSRDSTIIPDSVYFPDIENFIPDVRVELYWELIFQQGGICPVCTQLLELHQLLDVHEALVTKGDVQGWPKNRRYIIFNLYNCVVVHRDCHDHSNRQKIWDYKCKMYGEKEMKRWYDSLPFKHHPRRF